MGFFFDGGEPASHIGHPELKELAQKSDGEMDPAKRKDMARQVTDGLTADDTLRALVPNPNIYVLTPDVQITKTGLTGGSTAGASAPTKSLSALSRFHGWPESRGRPRANARRARP